MAVRLRYLVWALCVLYVLVGVVLVPPLWAWSLVPGRIVFSPYADSALRPRPAFEYFNPAFAYVPDEREIDFGAPVPLGLGALFFFPERNPLLYFTDRDLFDERFDFLSFYDQLRHPGSVLINPGESPREIIVRIGRNTIRVTTDDGKPLLFNDVSGASGLSRPFTPLIPAPVLSHHYRRGPFYAVTGVFLASTGHSLAPNGNLRSVLEGEPVEPETRYEVTASASVAGGVSQSLSYGVTAYCGNAAVTVAPRLVGYYRAFTAEARIDAGAETDQDLLPAGTDSRYSLFLSYPGNGWGRGGRLDLGTAFSYGRVRGGISILNIVGVDTVTGLVTDEDQSNEPETITTTGSAPAVTVSAAYTVPLYRGVLEFAADGMASEAFSAHAGVSLFRGPLMVGVTGGYRGGFQGTARVGLRRGRRRIAIALNAHQSPFVQDVVWGLGLHLRVRS